MHLPPPIFSKVDMPQNYRFLPNLLFRVVEEQGPDGEVPPRPRPRLPFPLACRVLALDGGGEREREGTRSRPEFLAFIRFRWTRSPRSSSER
jgi:hypothetical protein